MLRELLIPKLFCLLFIVFTIVLCIIISPKDLVQQVSAKLKLITFEKETVRLRRQIDPGCLNSEFYCKRAETQHIDCGRVLRGDKAYTSSISNRKRIPMVADPHVDMTCSAMKSRITRNHRKLESLKMPIAFARIVYKDYEFLEKQVEVSWHPQNFFCFLIDSKAKKEFKSKMRELEKCIPNVIVLDEELRTDSFGHNMNMAHYKCLQRMKDVPGWSYLMTLQNHDVIGKSVYEISRILELFGGANDVEIMKESGRTEKQYKWDSKTLKLFRDESRVSQDVLSKSLESAKGAAQATLSRAAVEWMVDIVDPTVFMEQWNHGWYGVDEQWLATFQSNEFLGMPGHFTGQCLQEKEYETDFVSRWDSWQYDNNNYTVNLDKRCGSKHLRHLNCLLGIEDLPSIAQMPNLMFNKVPVIRNVPYKYISQITPSFDYSIVDCTAELLYNRTYLGQEDKKLEEEYYSNMVNVHYHKHHLEPGYTLNCTRSYQRWADRKPQFP